MNLLKIWKYVLILLIMVVIGWTGWPAYQGFMNTEYSAYFREDRFLDVREGDREDYVIGILGEPIEKGWDAGEHIFYYSLPREEGYFYERKIVFKEAKVEVKINQLTKD